MEQSDLLRLAVVTLDRLNIPHALVGAIASGIWGESRFTQDIDILIDLKLQQVALLCAAFPAPEFYVSQTAADEAVVRSGQFNVIHPSSGNKIDFMIVGRTPWASQQIQRRKRVELFRDQSAYVAAPEDVILAKLIYYRDGGSEKHLRDITGILKISGDSVDRLYIQRFAEQLQVDDLWDAIVRSVG